ncbi:MAG TPA: hypothetical protein VMR54_01225 [Thermoanaerobaculia bacterium]|nr:hypothetical protein [Thermoanaerobaculia bacterium]
MRRRLDVDREFERYFDGETNALPAFYSDQVRQDLGTPWEWLPAGGLSHDPNTDRASEEGTSREPVVQSGKDAIAPT